LVFTFMPITSLRRPFARETQSRKALRSGSWGIDDLWTGIILDLRIAGLRSESGHSM
jgi:hypothetical protein